MPELGVDWSAWPIYLAAFVCGYVLGIIPLGRLAGRALDIIAPSSPSERNDTSGVKRGGITLETVFAAVFDGAKILGAAWLAAYVIAIPFVIAAMDASFQSGVSEESMQALATRRMVECALLAGAGALLGHFFPVWRWVKRPRAK